MAVIIVEDGTGVAGANSYVSISDAKKYAKDRGVVLPTNDETSTMLIKAVDYLELFADKFKGCKTSDAQSLQFPRKGVVLGCGDCEKELPDNEIPKRLIAAQLQLVLAVNGGVDLSPVILSSDYVIEETVGVITTKYADPTKINGGNLSPVLGSVEKLLASLFKTNCCISLRTVRV